MRTLLKTFEQMRAEQSVYPTQIPTELQEQINEWFDTRRVCDNVLFPKFFKRVLNRDYETYRQILRLEPGISQYDWLVQTYHELLNESSGAEMLTGEGGSTTSTQESTEGTKEGNETGARGTDVTRSAEEAITKAETDNTTETKSGQHTTAEADTREGTRETETTEAERSEEAGNRNSRSTDGTASNGSTSGTIGTRQTEATRDETEQLNNGVHLDKVAPMSISYAAPGTADGLYHDSLVGAQGMPNLNWQTATSQSQDGSKQNLDNKRTSAGLSDETHSDTSTNWNTTARLNDEDVTTDRDKTVAGKSDETTESQSNKTTAGEHSEELEGARSSSGAEQRLSEGSENSNETTARSFEEEQTGNRTTTGATASNKSDSKTDSRIVKEIATGRTVDIATLLQNARAFIERSEAWEWLYRRLDVCFMGVFEDDEEDYYI